MERAVNVRWLLVLSAIVMTVVTRESIAQTQKSAEKKPAAAAADKEKPKTTPRSPSEEVPPPSTSIARPEEAAATPAEPSLAERLKTAEDNYYRLVLVSSLGIFVLAIFVGFEVISKVPATLHTPLMSGSNAISGITVVGAIIAAAAGWGFSSFLGFFAVILAMVNVVGGFLVTHRMLLMFKRK